MQAAVAATIEQGVSRVASASLALACGFACYRWLQPAMVQPSLGAFAGAAGAIAFMMSDRTLARIGSDRRKSPAFPFAVVDYAPPPLGELLLTDRHQPEPPAAEPLVLDDILEQLGPDSRVVRLFDRDSMPTPAQLKSRIDAHLGRGPAPAPAIDASQALHDALAELRRSMR